MRLPTVRVNRPLRKAGETGLVDMDRKGPRRSNRGALILRAGAMIRRPKWGCQLRWELLSDGEMVPLARGVDTLSSIWELEVQ